MRYCHDVLDVKGSFVTYVVNVFDTVRVASVTADRLVNRDNRQSESLLKCSEVARTEALTDGFIDGLSSTWMPNITVDIVCPIEEGRINCTIETDCGLLV